MASTDSIREENALIGQNRAGCCLQSKFSPTEAGKVNRYSHSSLISDGRPGHFSQIMTQLNDSS